MQLFGVFAMLTLLTYPRLLKSLTVTRVIQIGLLFTIPSAIILFFADSNLVMLGIAGVLLGISTLPISFLSNLLIIDCANYNEWQNMPRMEGTMSSISGFAQKIGNAFGVFFMGIMLSMAHFDGALNTQPDSAVSMIKFLYAFNPLIWSMLVFVVFCFYKLDKLKPTITLELESRKGQEKVMS
jgi:Na+/melibiose symporter-like transporter